MSATKKIAALVGSLRKESFSRRLALQIKALAPSSQKIELLEIGDLPLFNPDIDVEPPTSWSRFRNEISQADAVLFVTPEYNRSVPAALKNAIDVGSRPYGKSVWNGKPGAIVSIVPGALGGFGANHHLRQSMVFLNVPVLQQPEAYLGNAEKIFDEHGALVSTTAEFMTRYLHAFDRWIDVNTSKAEK